MQIRIESDEEAKECAKALLDWIKQGLVASGYLEPKLGEHEFHTGERNFLKALENWILFVSR